MKKLNILVTLLMGALLFTSCNSDRDDNPTFTLPTSFTLNVPANANNNVYDLINSSSITFTANQPDYGGFPLPTSYAMQVSMDSTFTDAKDGKVANYIELPTPFASTTMSIKASELNEQIIALYESVKNTDSYDNQVRPMYVRAKATVSTISNSIVYSNVVKLPNVLATYKAPDISLPTDMYVVGGSIGDSWKTWQKMTPVFNSAGQFYTVVYMPANGEFKFGTKENDYNGASAIKTITDTNNAAGVSAGSGDNIKFANAGWYVLKFVDKIKGGKIQYELIVDKAVVNITGTTVGNFDTAVPCTAPADQTGEWVSQPFTAAGEVRAYVKVPGADWWRTEFTMQISTGNIRFRVEDIPNNWMETLGADYSIQAKVGQKLYFSFDTGKASLK